MHRWLKILTNIKLPNFKLSGKKYSDKITISSNSLSHDRYCHSILWLEQIHSVFDTTSASFVNGAIHGMVYWSFTGLSMSCPFGARPDKALSLIHSAALSIGSMYAKTTCFFLRYILEVSGRPSRKMEDRQYFHPWIPPDCVNHFTTSNKQSMQKVCGKNTHLLVDFSVQLT